jgi:predicted DNA-binding transcriptional regulator AlpA
MCDDLVGVAEIADLLGISRQRVNRIVQTHTDFPSPIAELTAGRIWRQSAIEEWAASHDRTIEA